MMDSSEYLKSVKQRFVKSRKYPVCQACGENEFKEFELALTSFSLALKYLLLDDRQFTDNIRLYNAVIQKAPALGKDKVLFPILDMSFVCIPVFMEYLNRIACYRVAIDTIFELQKRNSGPSVMIEFTEPRTKDHPLPTLTELQQSSLDPRDTDVPTDDPSPSILRLNLFRQSLPPTMTSVPAYDISSNIVLEFEHVHVVHPTPHDSYQHRRWILDSGASSHYIRDIDRFRSFSWLDVPVQVNTGIGLL